VRPRPVHSRGLRVNCCCLGGGVAVIAAPLREAPDQVRVRQRRVGSWIRFDGGGDRKDAASTMAAWATIRIRWRTPAAALAKLTDSHRDTNDEGS
jgi:hypothetical protein